MRWVVAFENVTQGEMLICCHVMLVLGADQCPPPHSGGRFLQLLLGAGPHTVAGAAGACLGGSVSS